MFRNVPKDSTTSLGNSNPGGSHGGRGAGTFRGRGRGRDGFKNRRPEQQDPDKCGLYADGIWLCNCMPRLPAEHFKVKKEGRNQGRYFHTCQNSEGRRCGFLLWDEDAKPREEAAVLSGRRDEPKITSAAVSLSGPTERPLGHSPTRQPVTSQMSTQSQESPQPYDLQTPRVSQASSSATYRNSSLDNTKRKRPLYETGLEFDHDDVGGDSFPWDLTRREADELEERASLAPETPRKAIKTTAYATPATASSIRQLPWLENTSGDGSPRAGQGSEMPSKPTGLVNLPTPSLVKPFANSQNTNALSRFRNAISDPSVSSPLVNEASDLLNNASISLTSDLSTRLRAILSRHELKTQGISRGRDIVRLALKAKDAKIVELNARAAALEAEREVDKARIQHLKWTDSGVDEGE